MTIRVTNLCDSPLSRESISYLNPRRLVQFAHCVTESVSHQAIAAMDPVGVLVGTPAEQFAVLFGESLKFAVISQPVRPGTRTFGMTFVPKLRDQSFLSKFREVNKMLVLSRREGEQLLIGDDIVLTINRISGNRVAIGIEAPREVRVIRGELERHDVASGGVASMAASMDETNIAIASKPHC